MTTRMCWLIFGLVVFGNCLISGVSGHGRLIDPPSRASMWRYGFNTPRDYDDHQSYCGGFARQWERNNGKCGICGDAYDTPEPRDHETGGKYGKSVIVRKYRTGSVIPVQVQITANHGGYFEFHLCPMTVQGKEIDAECLEKNILVGENGTARYYPGPGNMIFEMKYKLPDNLTCAQCVFQWRYVAANNWGTCADGTDKQGCGRQEEFRACADITIGDSEATLPPRSSTFKTPTTPSIGLPTPKRTENQPTEPTLEPPFEPETTGPYWLFSLVIAGTSLLVVLAAFALLYTYYYHAGKAKQWLMDGRLMKSQSQPVAPPRHKRHPNSISHISLQLSN